MKNSPIKPILLFMQYVIFSVGLLICIWNIKCSHLSYMLICATGIVICFLFNFWPYLKKIKLFKNKKSFDRFFSPNKNNLKIRFCYTLTFVMTFLAMSALYEAYTCAEESVFVNAIRFIVILMANIQTWLLIVAFLNIFVINSKRKYVSKNTKINLWFFSSWAIIGLIYLVHLVLIQFPGIVNTDAFYQMDQILYNSYNGLYAYTHTQLINFFIWLGNVTFQNLYASIFMFCLVQAILLSLAFAYIIRTIKEVNGSKILCVVSIVLFALVPCHIFLSATMFSDVYFCISVCVFTITLFRLFMGFAKIKWYNSVLVIISTLGTALFRSNGIYVIILMFIVFLAMFWQKLKEQQSAISKSFYALAVSISVAFVFLGPVSSFIGITNIDLVNKISIPGQQVAKVVTECDDLNELQIDMVNNVLDINELRHWFDKNNFDPLKFHIRSNGNQEYINQHMPEFIALYFDLGIKHPDKYISALIDSTSDYWSPHINSHLFLDPNLAFLEQDYQQIVFCESLRDFFYGYMQFYDDYLTNFQSIGLYTWIFIICFAFALYRRDRKIIYSFIPCLSILFVVLAATPIINEIRYVYPVICLSTFFISITFLPKGYFNKIRKTN